MPNKRASEIIIEALIKNSMHTTGTQASKIHDALEQAGLLIPEPKPLEWVACPYCRNAVGQCNNERFHPEGPIKTILVREVME